MLRRIAVSDARTTGRQVRGCSSSSSAAAAASVSEKLNPLALNGFQLYSRSKAPTSTHLHVRAPFVPRGMCAMSIPNSSAVIEELASKYAETMTLKDMSSFHHAVVKNAQQTQQFYENALLNGFSGGGGGGGGVIAAMRNAAAPAAATTAAGGASGENSTAEAPKAKVAAAKTSFNVQLAKFDPSIKIKLIKELRTVTNLPLGEAKAAIDKCPGMVASNMSKDDAEKLKKAFEDLGATVELL